MAEVRRESLADQAAELLLDRIRGGEWQLGQRLPGETTLAPQLGVGRSTVREAIRKLAGNGVLASRQGAGVFVTALDVPEDWDVVVKRAGILSVIEARTAIEAEAAMLAAERRTPEALRVIRRALRVRSESISDIEAHVDADTAFHRSVIAAADNDILLELFDGFVPRIRHAMIDMLRIQGRFGGDDDQDVHAQLADAIAERDAARAAALSRSHLASLREGLR